MWNRINTIRKDHNLSYEKFAEHINVDESTVRKWQNGRQIQAGTVKKICKEFEVSANWLLFGEGPMRKDVLQFRQEKSLLTAWNNLFVQFIDSKISQAFLESTFQPAIEVFGSQIRTLEQWDPSSAERYITEKYSELLAEHIGNLMTRVPEHRRETVKKMVGGKSGICVLHYLKFCDLLVRIDKYRKRFGEPDDADDAEAAKELRDRQYEVQLLHNSIVQTEAEITKTIKDNWSDAT